jgi:hypothetical protein
MEGWDHIPAGYGARFELGQAPAWLRIWFATPFLDRFACPVAVRRGYGHLSPHPGTTPETREQPGRGWHVHPAPPGTS